MRSVRTVAGVGSAEPDRRRGGDPEAPRVRSRWLTLAVVLIGAYGSALNTTAIGVALPAIERDIGGRSGTFGADWVVTALLVGMLVVQPLTAWSADRWGRTKVYAASLVAFGSGSAMCALAPGMVALVAARFIQGMGAGALLPVGLVIVYELFPPGRRGLALGLWGIGMAGAPAAGPSLGGWVVTAGSWRLVFVAFTVITVVALILSRRFLRDTGFRESRRFDTLGWSLSAAGLVLVVVVARQAGTWGLWSPATVAFGTLTAVVLVAFVAHALRHPEPVIELRVFSTRTFSVAMFLVALASIAQYARLTFLPVELQVVRGLTASEVGVILAPAAIGVALTMPLGGWLADRVGTRPPIVVGLACMCFSLWELGHLGHDEPTAWITMILVVQGLGSGLVFAPTTVAAMNSLAPRFAAQASTTRAMTRQLSSAIGVAVLGGLVVSEIGAVAPDDPPLAEAQAAYNHVFVVAFWVVVVGLATALMMPGRRQTRPAAIPELAGESI